MQTFTTIIPIFAVIFLGFYAHRKGLMPPEFLGPANQLVYFLAIPALIFRAVSRASFHEEFNATVLLVTLSSAMLAYCVAWLIGRCTSWDPGRIGTFIQCSGHGNHGYIGLPIALYFLGESGLVKTSILAGFLMILQNILSVLILQAYSVSERNMNLLAKLGLMAEKLVRNPVIISALAGIAASLLQLSLPSAIQRFIDILSGLAPPLSLLLIGASISFEVIRKSLFSVLGSVAIKLLLLPTLGLALFTVFHLQPSEFLPGIILLATPTATVTYVMSKEMYGDPEFAVAAISASTLFSALTYLFWLMMIAGNDVP